MALPPPPGFVPVDELQKAYNEGKALATEAGKQRDERIQNAVKMVVPPPGEVPQELLAQRKRQVVFASDAQAGTKKTMSTAAVLVSQRQESKRSKVFNELRQQRAEQSNFVTYKLMNNGALKQVIEHIFRVACSHGKDLEDQRMSRHNFKIFMEQFGVTTSCPYDQFEYRSLLAIREKSATGEEHVDEVQLLRFGTENVDMLFEYGLDRIGVVVVNALGGSPDFESPAADTSDSKVVASNKPRDERLTCHEFIVALIECVHKMIPADYYPPLAKVEVHMLLLETFFFHLFGKPYLTKQIPSGFDDFNMVETMAEVIGNAYSILGDMFLFCIAPLKFDEWSDQERSDRYIRIAVGDAVIEYESFMEVIKKLKMPFNMLAAEPTYELFCRYDCKMKKDRVVIDFQGFTLVCAHIAFTLYFTNAAYPTPQSKFQRLVEQYLVPHFPQRLTIPHPKSAEHMIALDGIKPERAVVGTELWVFGQEFPIRPTQDGHRCPLYVRFNDVIAKGACMSTNVGNVVVPRLPTSEDTVTQVSLTDGEEPGTFSIRLEAKTIAIVSISNDRLRWTKIQSVRLSFEDVLATYNIPTDLVQLLKSLFSAFGEKGPDFEQGGEVLPGPIYLSVANWSKICQQLPMCVYDDGDSAYFVSRHVKFFENAKPRGDALDITVPVVNFPEMVNLIFKLFIAQHGPDERLIDTISEALKNAPAAIEQCLIEKKPKRRKSVMGAERLAEYQKIYSQVADTVIKEGFCINCGQDPVVRAGDNPFIDLEMIKRPALSAKGDGEPLDVIFSKAVSRFTESLPRDAASEELTEQQFTRMSVEQADELADRGKFYFLNNLVQRLIDRHYEDHLALESRFHKAIDKVRTHGRWVTMQLFLAQQTMEAINDGLSRISAIVIEHENLAIEERKARLSGFISQSDTFGAMTLQLYQGLKATVNTVKDMTKPYINEEDPDKFDVRYMFEETASFKQFLFQQSMQLEAAITLRLEEIRKGPQQSAEGLVRRKYISHNEDEDEDEDDDPEAAALRRQMSKEGQDLLKRQSMLGRAAGGASEEEIQKRLSAQQEIIEAAWDVKLKEAEKRKDQVIRECSQLLEGLMRHSQEYVDIPAPLANPCFKFLHDRGSQLKRVVREGSADPMTPNGAGPVGSGGGGSSGSGGGGYMKAFVLTEEAGNQSDEDQFPSMLAMQQELLARGITGAVKLGGPAVLLRKALTYARDVLGKYSSNATIFSDLTKIMKIELQNVMNPRTRDLLPLPQSVGEMYSRDSVVNTELTFADFNYVASYVTYQTQLENLVALTNVAKEESIAQAAKLNKRGAMGRRMDAKVSSVPLDVPISPNTAALSARPEEMMALISPDSVLPLEQRIERRLLERNAKYIHAIRAPGEGRCKTIQTESRNAVDASYQTDPIFIQSIEEAARQQQRLAGDGDDDDDNSPASKSLKKKERSSKSKKGDEKVEKVEKSTKLSDKPPAVSSKSAPRATPQLKNSGPSTPQIQSKLVVDEDIKATDGVVVIDDANLSELVTAAEKFSRVQTVAGALSEGEAQIKTQTATKVSSKPNKIPKDEPIEVNREERKAKERIQKQIDLPGPSLQSGEKVAPASLTNTGQSCEDLMKQRWDNVLSPTASTSTFNPQRFEKEEFEEIEVEEVEEAQEEGSASPDRKIVKKIVVKRVAPAVVTAEVHDNEEANDEPESSEEDEDESETAEEDEESDEDPEEVNKRIEIGYVEDDHIPDISLVSAEAKAIREAQTREIEASTARLSAVIEEAMKSNPDVASAYIQIQGMNELVHQLRGKIKELEQELESNMDQNKALKNTVGELKRYAVQCLDGKTVVMREAKPNQSKGTPATQQQVEIARGVLAEKATVRSRIGRLLKKYGIVNPAITKKFEESNSSTMSSGLTELGELLEMILAGADKATVRSAFSSEASSPAATPVLNSRATPVGPAGGNLLPPQSTPPHGAQRGGAGSNIVKLGGNDALANRAHQAISDDCIVMLRVHFQDDVRVASGTATALLEECPLAALPVLARLLLDTWQKGNVAELVRASGVTNAGSEAPASPQSSRDGGSRRSSRLASIVTDPTVVAAINAATSYFDALVPQCEQLTDNDIRTTADMIAKLRCASPAARERTKFLISQHATMITEANAAAATIAALSTTATQQSGSMVPLSSSSQAAISSHFSLGNQRKARTDLTPIANQPASGLVMQEAPVSVNPIATATWSKVPLFPGSNRWQGMPSYLDDGAVAANSSCSHTVVDSKTLSVDIGVQVSFVPQTAETDAQTIEPSPPQTPHSSKNSLFNENEKRDSVADGSDYSEEEFDYAAYHQPSHHHHHEPVDSVNAPSKTPRRLISFASAETQTNPPPQKRHVTPTPKRDAEMQSEASERCVFIPSLPWHNQINALYSSIRNSALDNARTHEESLPQWLLGVYHCLRSNIGPNLELVAKMMIDIRNAALQAKTEMADLSQAVLDMMSSGVKSLDESCGGPLKQYMRAAGLHLPVDSSGIDNGDFSEVNILIANLLTHVDHRLGPNVKAGNQQTNSQRSLNRWRTHVILTLLDTMDSELQPCFSKAQRDAMKQLVEYDELTCVQQRRLFLLQTTAISLIIFSHCSRKNFVPLAAAARVETPVPLSLQASSTGYLRMVRDCLLAKVVPERFNDIGMRAVKELSLLSKQFVSRIIGFTREEFSWLHAMQPESRSKTESVRYDELCDTIAKASQWNPAPHDLSTIDWLEVMRHTLLLLLGPDGRIVPASLEALSTKKIASSTATAVTSDAGEHKQVSHVVDEPPAAQPSSLHEPPSFLREVQWATTAKHRFAPAASNAYAPLKCETPPPMTSTSPIPTVGKAAFTPGKVTVSKSASFSGTLPASTVVANGGSALGINTTQHFSAAASPSVVVNVLNGVPVSSVRGLTLSEQRELKDLREICSGGQLAATPLRCYRAWIDLEVRQRVAELRAMSDVDDSVSAEELQNDVQQALRAVEPSLAASTRPSTLAAALQQLTAAQTRLFVQTLRREQLRGSKIPALK